ncbi:MAG: hypothetical protein IPJ34_01965 [Myxococcales bacterium]|nr:hypothetical protein [Myxococcales bacterium]
MSAAEAKKPALQSSHESGERPRVSPEHTDEVPVAVELPFEGSPSEDRVEVWSRADLPTFTIPTTETPTVRGDPRATTPSQRRPRATGEFRRGLLIGLLVGAFLAFLVVALLLWKFA